MSGAGNPLQSHPMKPPGHTRQESYQDSSNNPTQSQPQPPPSQESDWSRGGALGVTMSSQRPASSNQQHERSFSSASMLNSSGPTASQPAYSNRNSMGPGGLLQLQQQAGANSRFNSGGPAGGPPQLGALSFQEPPQPTQGPQFSSDSPARELAAPHYPSQGSTAPVQEREPSRPVFGVSLNRLYERDGLAVPMVVYQCIQAVDLFGLNLEGIYRLSGSVPHVNKLKSMFDTGKLLRLNVRVHDLLTARKDTTSPQLDFRNPENFFHDVNSVAGLLKQFFRDLPDPLLTREHYADFIAAASKYHHRSQHPSSSHSQILTLFQQRMTTTSSAATPCTRPSTTSPTPTTPRSARSPCTCTASSNRPA